MQLVGCHGFVNVIVARCEVDKTQRSAWLTRPFLVMIGECHLLFVVAKS